MSHVIDIHYSNSYPLLEYLIFKKGTYLDLKVEGVNLNYHHLMVMKYLSS